MDSFNMIQLSPFNRVLISLFVSFLILMHDCVMYNLENPVLCPSVTGMKHLKYKTTIIINYDNINYSGDDDLIINCFLRNGESQSFVVIDNINLDYKFWKKTKKTVIIEPNILMLTDFPTTKIIDELAMKKIWISKWSLLVIVATTRDENLVCNDTQDENIMNMKLKTFANDIWIKYHIINIVLSLPFVCPGHYFTYGERNMTSDSESYNRSIKYVSYEDSTVKLYTKGNTVNLTYNYPLHVNIFKRFPTSIKDCKGLENYINFNGNLSNYYCGLDGLIMSDIVKYFGFKTHTHSASEYGYLNSYRKVTGSLGLVVRGEVDISFNSRFQTWYGVSGISYLHYVSSDKLCAIVKTSDEKPLWLFPYENLPSWLFVLIALVLVGIVLWFTVKIMQYREEYRKPKIQMYVLDSVITGLFGFSATRHRFLVLKGICFFSSILFLSYFQSHVNYAYTTLVRYHQINSLEDLYDSDSTIYTTEGIVQLISPPHNKISEELANRMIINDNKTYEILHEKTASLGRRSDMILQTMKYYTDSKGQPLLHVVEECFRGYLLAFIANRDFPFVDDVTILVQKLLEAGLPNKYYTWTQQSLGLFDTSASVKNSIPRPTTPIALLDVCIPFIILIIGYLLAIIVFIIERWELSSR